MDEFRLKRGGREVVFRKSPSHFAVRLKQGKAGSKTDLASATNQDVSEVRHVAALRQADMDLFAVSPRADVGDTTDALRKAPASSVVTHAYTMGDDPELLVPTGTMTIQFRPDTPDAKREALFQAHGLEIVEDLDFLPHGYTVRLSSSATKNPLKIASDLQSDESVVVAEVDFSFRRTTQSAPTLEPLYPLQWHLRNRGDATGLVAGADCKAEGAWELTFGSRDIVVCVIDDGFDLGHPDFASPGKVVAPYDFGQNDADPSPGSSDDNHGTACAGVAVADASGSGGVGLAPGCTFMPVRMAEYLTDDAVVAMFQHAMDHGADVISCSWSAAAPYFPLSTKMSAILTKVATQGRRNSKGCVILFAAGNESAPLDGRKNGVTYYQGFALHPHVVAVAASNSLDKHSSYSNYGPAIAFCAPSSGSPGRGVVTTDRRGSPGYSPADHTTTFGGTSSATPLAAGCAALVLSVNPNLTSAEVKQVLMATAERIDQAGGSYDAVGHSPLYGHGRINAEAAVKAASGLQPRLPRTLAMEHRVHKPVADMATVQDAIPFPLDVRPVSIEVSFELRHTYVGDLRITLSAPNGRSLVAYEREGGSGDEVARVLRSSDDPAAFEPFLGASAKGDWKLVVQDLAREDEGVLVRWGIAVSYEAA